MSKIQDKSSLS